MYRSIMPKLKHSFTDNAKHNLLLSRKYREYTKAMLKPEDYEDLNYADDAAIRIREALATIPRGGRKPLLDRCIDRHGKKGITPQAITGWMKNGRVNQYNLAILSDITGFRLEYLIRNDLPKLKSDYIDSYVIHKELSHDKSVMELTDDSDVTLELITSKAGGSKLDRRLPYLDAAEAKSRKESVVTQSEVVKEMIENIEVTQYAYKYIARGVGMLPDIKDGDTVLIDPGIEPVNSDRVLVEISGDQCIMQFWKVAGESWLTFTNPAYSDLKKPFSSALMLGVALAILHKPTSLRNI